MERLKRSYQRAFRNGLTIAQLRKLFEEHNWRCDICDTPWDDSKLAGGLGIDHDHSCCPSKPACGKCVRGLLCHRCNSGLGNFRDDPKLLRKAIDYLAGGKAA